MAGSYCRYCDRRCFVARVLPEGKTHLGLRELHMATCAEGKAHDRNATGYDADTALNPVTDCVCVVSCADHPPTACSLSGQPHVHPDDGSGTFGPCPVHPDAPGDL